MSADNRQKTVARLLAVIACLVVLGYSAVVAGFYIFQRSLQYVPSSQPVGTPAAVGLPEMEVTSVKTDDGLRLLAWFVPPKEKTNKIIIVFHGNSGSIAHRAAKAKYFMHRGYGVFLAEYRGYGGNPGQPTEEGLYKDGRAALGWLAAKGYQQSQFVLYGNSLGSGVAIHLALENAVKMIILEAPYTSTAEVGQLLYPLLPVSLLMVDRFDSLSKIGKIHAALLVVHGDKDGFIPISQGKKLFEAANTPKDFITIEGGAHGNLYSFGAGNKIAAWLDRQVMKENKK